MRKQVVRGSYSVHQGILSPKPGTQQDPSNALLQVYAHGPVYLQTTGERRGPSGLSKQADDGVVCLTEQQMKNTLTLFSFKHVRFEKLLYFHMSRDKMLSVLVIILLVVIGYPGISK